MRRALAAAAAAVTLGPLLLASAPNASAASHDGTLTVNVIGRDGGPAPKSEITIYDPKTKVTHYLKSGRPIRLQLGHTENLAAQIWNDAAISDTVAEQVVTVGSATKVTLDARKGKRVSESLSPLPKGQHLISSGVVLCTSFGEWVETGWEPDVPVYAIPAKAPGMKSIFAGVWGTGTLDSDESYYTAQEFNGIPAETAITTRQSSLVTLKVTADQGPETGVSDVTVSRDAGDLCQGIAEDGYDALVQGAKLPQTQTLHLPAGSWKIRQAAADVASSPYHTYAAGKTYSVVLNHAVVGPAGQLPYTTVSGHRLHVAALTMFTDPVVSTGDRAQIQYKLTQGSRTVAAGSTDYYTRADFDPVITKAGWYDLSESAVREVSVPGRLSSASSINLHFYASPNATDQVRDYLTRFTPAGLDSHNRAKAGTRTTVTLGMLRNAPTHSGVHQLSDSVKKVAAWYSTDGGKTWHSVSVEHTGSSWTTSVPNPASGTVSLRAETTDSHGDTATTTVIDGYAIGG